MLVKGIQDYIGGDDIEEDEYVDEAINEDVMQTELISDDFDAVQTAHCVRSLYIL